MAITQDNPQSLANSANANSYTLANYAVADGSNRVLIVIAHLQRNTQAGFTATCAYGAASMSVAVTQSSSSTNRW